MSLPVPIVEKEIDNNENKFVEKLIKNNEHFHNGTTFIVSEISEDKDERYFQFKTIIEENNQKYFIYDEVIEINEKPVLLTRIYNDEKREIWEQIIYLEKNNEVIEQIRFLTYQQFLSEVKQDKTIIRTEEDSNTIIIKTPFLEFIDNINEEKNEFKQQKPIKKIWWKRLPWKILGLIVFVAAWAAIPVIGNLLIAPLLVGVVSASVMTWLPFAIAGLITGCAVAGFNRFRTRLKKWIFPKWKAKNEINLDNKLAEERKLLEKELKNQLFLSLTAKAKQERLLNGFQEISNKNKVKTFATIETELSTKIAKKQNEEIQQKLQKIEKLKIELETSNQENEKTKAELEVVNQQLKTIKDNLEMIIFVKDQINKEKAKCQPNQHNLNIFKKEIVYFINETLEKNKKNDNSVNIKSVENNKKKSQSMQ